MPEEYWFDQEAADKAVAFFPKYCRHTEGEWAGLLNQGATGIAAMEKEADQLGLTIDAKTAAAAEAFNDNLTRLKSVLKGVITKVTAKMLPALQRFSEYVVAAAKSGNLLGLASAGLVKVLKFVARTVAEGALFFARMNAELSALGRAFQAFKSGEFRKGFKIIADAGAETEEQFRKMRAAFDDMFKEGDPVIDKFADDFRDKLTTPVIQSTKEATAALREQQAVMREGAIVFEQTRTPMEALALEQQRLSELMRKGGIDANTWSRANSKAVATTANAYLGLASEAAGALGTLFGESKGFAIAQAVINTAQAITATLAQYGATPWGLAAAGVAAAAGAAQIASIRSASKSGGGSTSSPGGGGSTAPASNPAAAPSVAQTFSINSVGDDDLFRGDIFNKLIEEIQERQADGDIRLLLAG